MKVNYQNELFKIRKIEDIGKDINSYIFEQICQELSDLNISTIQCQEKIQGVYKGIQSIYIISDYYSFNLQEYILKTKPDAEKKLRIFLKIAICVKNLHMKNLAHGHLSPKNIQLDENENIFLSDYHFQALRKVQGIKGYNMKSAYSSPEILITERVVKFEKSNDIYSLGIIQWGLMTNIIPFSGLDSNKLKEIIAYRKMRPKIKEEDWGEDQIRLLRQCWADNPEDRINIDSIISEVDDFLGNSFGDY